MRLHPLILIVALLLASCDDADNTNSTNNATSTNNTNSTNSTNSPSPCEDVVCPENSHCVWDPQDEETSCPCDTGFFVDLQGECHHGASLGQRELSGQTFVYLSETRYYYLYVPSTYSHDRAVPLLVDLHGTASFIPEEAYGLEAARAAAEANGFLLLRPRSRSSQEGEYTIYRWDQNPGDTDRNHQFLTALVQHLSTQYFLSRDHLYIMGFSSGTNQTARALADGESLFRGYGFIGGGVWHTSPLQNGDKSYYLATGYRDYMRTHHYTLVERLEEAGALPGQVFEREFDGGHELYGFFYEELFAFLHHDARPEEGTLSPPWQEVPFSEETTLLALAETPTGEIVAGGASNSLYLRESDGSWSPLPIGGTSAFPGRAVTDLCFTRDGTGVAIGEGQLIRSRDGGHTWTHEPKITETDTPIFGYQHLNGLTCDGSRVIATGYWQGAYSDDGGATWQDQPFPTEYGYRAQGAELTSSDWGTVVGTGYWSYIGVSTDGVAFSSAAPPSGATADWYYDASPAGQDRWVVVGDFGTILISEDDGENWSCARCEGGENLYAVTFRGERGIAVGQHCAVWVTQDGGVTWTDHSCGLDRVLGAAHWINDNEVLVAGQGGTLLTLDLRDLP